MEPALEHTVMMYIQDHLQPCCEHRLMDPDSRDLNVYRTRCTLQL